MVPPFPERVHFIIRHAFNLRHFQYIAIDENPSSDYSVRLLRTCITALEWSENKPKLSIRTRRPILGTPLRDLLLYINDRFSVTLLDVQSEGTQDNHLLEFLARFREQQELFVWDFRSTDNNEHDMDRFLLHLPLRKLSVYDTDQVASFPRQLRALEIYYGVTIHTHSVWAATCNLTRLSELHMECRDTEELHDEDPFVFKSTNLRILSGTLAAKTEEILRKQIIEPIFASCQSLTSVSLRINSSLSSTMLTIFLSNETLVDIDLSSAASPYTFQEFADRSKTLPNLELLQLPWPASIGVSTNDDDGTEMDWRHERDGSQDVPERLTFDQCQALAAKLPKLKEIVFEINTESMADAYLTWAGPIHHIMPLDPRKVAVAKSGVEQSFKMVTFVDEESPCVNICSVFAYSCRRSIYNGEEHEEMSMYLLLSLTQVRRHAAKRYNTLQT
jgi:hypothetical protein